MYSCVQAEYAVDHNVHGVSIWDISLDDFNGECGDGRYPLLTTINTILNDPTSTTSGTTSSSTTSTATTEIISTLAPSLENTDSPVFQGNGKDRGKKYFAQLLICTYYVALIPIHI